MFPVLGLFLSCIYLHFIRLQLNRTLFQRYHNTIIDSNANGKHNIVVIVCFIICIVSLLVKSLVRSLGVYYDDVADGAFFYSFWSSFYLASTIVTLSGSPIFILNEEFKNFLLRKLSNVIIFDTRTFFQRSRNKVLSAKQDELERPGMKMRQKSGRGSELDSTIILQEDQQLWTVLNEDKSQCNSSDPRNEVDQEPGFKLNIETSTLMFVQEAEYKV